MSRTQENKLARAIQHRRNEMRAVRIVYSAQPGIRDLMVRELEKQIAELTERAS